MHLIRTLQPNEVRLPFPLTFDRMEQGQVHYGRIRKNLEALCKSEPASDQYPVVNLNHGILPSSRPFVVCTPKPGRCQMREGGEVCNTHGLCLAFCERFVKNDLSRTGEWKQAMALCMKYSWYDQTGMGFFMMMVTISWCSSLLCLSLWLVLSRLTYELIRGLVILGILGRSWNELRTGRWSLSRRAFASWGSG